MPTKTHTSFADLENEELRVQVNTLKYELENIKQERDLTVLRHEKEMRELQLKADADFRKAQVGSIQSERGKRLHGSADTFQPPDSRSG